MSVRSWGVILPLLAIGLIYLCFPLNCHQWEGYMYAAGTEGLFSVADIYRFSGIDLPLYLDFNIYHPNHPLLHLAAFSFSRFLVFLGFTTRALKIVTVLNTAAALLGLTCFALSAGYLFSRDIPLAVLLVLLVGVTDITWYYSLSAEVYAAPVAAILVCLCLLFRLEEKLSRCGKTGGMVFSVAFTFGIALAFHMLAAPFALVILYFFYGLGRRFPCFDLKNAVLVFAGVVLVFCFLFYIIFPVWFIGVRSVHDLYICLFFFACLSLAFSSLSSPGFCWKLFHACHDHIGMKMNSFMNGLIRGDTAAVVVYKFAILFFFAGGALLAARRRDLTLPERSVILWFLVYALFLVFVVAAPVDDYFIFLTHSFFLCLAILWRPVLGAGLSRALLGLAVILNGMVNFRDDIYPKHCAGIREHSLLAAEDGIVKKGELFFFIEDGEHEDFYDDFFFVNYLLGKRRVLLLHPGQIRRLLCGDLLVDRLASLFGPREFVDFPDNIVLVSYGETDEPVACARNFRRCGYRVVSRRLERREKSCFEKLGQYPRWYVPKKYSYNNRLRIFLFTLRPGGAPLCEADPFHR